MYKVIDGTILVTRGDVVSLGVSAEDSKGNPYTFKAGDVLRFKVFEKKDTSSVVLQKDFSVDVEKQSVDIFLSGADTKLGSAINKPKEYWYEIELNPDTFPQTIVGYTEDGPAVLRLFPEGAGIEELGVSHGS